MFTFPSGEYFPFNVDLRLRLIEGELLLHRHGDRLLDEAIGTWPLENGAVKRLKDQGNKRAQERPLHQVERALRARLRPVFQNRGR